MNKILPYFMSIVLCVAWLNSSAALNTSKVSAVEVSRLTKKTPPVLASSSWLVQDLLSKQVIASRNSQKRFAPNELSKLMIAYVFMKHIQAEDIDLNSTITIQDSVLTAKGLRLYLEPGNPYSLSMLVQAMLVMQANDATYALVNTVTQTETQFVKKMNAYAQALGMVNTQFVSIDEQPIAGQYTTAHDMAILAQALVGEFGETLRPIFSMPEFRTKDLSYPNPNRLLWLDSTIKGMMASSATNNYSLVALGQRGPREVLVVTVGAKSDDLRVQDSLSLFNWAFQTFQTYQLYAPNQVIMNLRVWKGATNSMPVGVPQGLWLTLPKELDASAVTTHYERPDPLFAPFRAGTTLGKLTLKVHDKTLKETPLFVLENVRASGLLKRIFDQILLWFRF